MGSRASDWSREIPAGQHKLLLNRDLANERCRGFLADQPPLSGLCPTRLGLTNLMARPTCSKRTSISSRPGGGRAA
jgi:hypothetical protein